MDAALDGASIVIDLANSPSFEDAAAMEFFQTSGRNLLAAGKKAGVVQHIALSVVGTAKLQASGYFRAKQAQEELIEASGTPYTIVHSTQFFEFMGAIARAATDGNEVRLSSAPIQPIISAATTNSPSVRPHQIPATPIPVSRARYSESGSPST